MEQYTFSPSVEDFINKSLMIPRIGGGAPVAVWWRDICTNLQGSSNVFADLYPEKPLGLVSYDWMREMLRGSVGNTKEDDCVIDGVMNALCDHSIIFPYEAKTKEYLPLDHMRGIAPMHSTFVVYPLDEAHDKLREDHALPKVKTWNAISFEDLIDRTFTYRYYLHLPPEVEPEVEKVLAFTTLYVYSHHAIRESDVQGWSTGLSIPKPLFYLKYLTSFGLISTTVPVWFPSMWNRTVDRLFKENAFALDEDGDVTIGNEFFVYVKELNDHLWFGGVGNEWTGDPGDLFDCLDVEF